MFRFLLSERRRRQICHAVDLCRSLVHQFQLLNCRSFGVIRLLEVDTRVLIDFQPALVVVAPDVLSLLSRRLARGSLAPVAFFLLVRDVH